MDKAEIKDRAITGCVKSLCEISADEQRAGHPDESGNERAARIMSRAYYAGFQDGYNTRVDADQAGELDAIGTDPDLS